jgi:hypothetical protein
VKPAISNNCIKPSHFPPHCGCPAGFTWFSRGLAPAALVRPYVVQHLSAKGTP